MTLCNVKGIVHNVKPTQLSSIKLFCLFQLIVLVFWHILFQFRLTSVSVSSSTRQQPLNSGAN